MSTNIAVLGGRSESRDKLELARQVGSGLAKAGAVLICGGLGGIMRAAAEGCREAGGISVGILPSLDKSDGNQFLDVVLPTSLGYGRNILIASASDAVIAIGGNYGTMSELAFALNYGRKVVVIAGTGGVADYLAGGDIWKGVIKVARGAREAVRLALGQ